MTRRPAWTPKDRQGALAIFAVAALVVVVFAALFYRQYSQPVYGPDQCELVSAKGPQRKPVAQTVVLLDQSEALTPSQREFVRQNLEGLISDLHRGERILFYTFSRDEFQSLQPRLALCKPKDTANPLFDTELNVRSHLRGKFVRPVLKFVSSSLAEEVGQYSPILEALHSLSRAGQLEIWDKPYRLVVISDLLQHWTDYSHYSESPDYPTWKARHGERLVTSFNDWTVDIVYLERFKDLARQGDAHREFWQQYFHDAGARIERIRRVP